MSAKFAALLAVLAAGPALADGAVIVPDPAHVPPMIRGDVPAGHYQNWRGDLSCGTNALRAVFHVAKLYDGTQWAPMVKIGLGEEHAKYTAQELRDTRRIALHLVRFDPAGSLEVAVSLYATKEIKRSTYKVSGALGQSIPVEIRWDENGVISLDVAGKTLNGTHLDRAPASIDFVLSGVQGQIGGIEVGRIGPPSTACPQAAAPSVNP